MVAFLGEASHAMTLSEPVRMGMRLIFFLLI